MTFIRPIRTEADYDSALERIEVLMDEASDDDRSQDELEVLCTLVEAYEAKHHPIDLPDPIDAIKFRMEQEGLSQKDLEPFIGSRSKVSEVLSRKRSLTLAMIRALNKHLGIPAEVLIGKENSKLPENMSDVVWEKFPLLQMAKLGWVSQTENFKDRAEEIMRDLITRACGEQAIPAPMYRKNNSVRRNAKMDPYALQAWCLHVLAKARSQPLTTKYDQKTITAEFLREVARLSQFEEGPKLAKEFLAKHGIVLIYAAHLPKTHLDGAAMRTVEGVPVVGVTIRYDRIDNFWFCLLHELAHIGHHLTDDESMFVDDLSLNESDHDESWEKEREADQIALDALIPADIWQEYQIAPSTEVSKVLSIAKQAGVHPAIVAGRIRKESGNYRQLTKFVGNGEVRRCFADCN
ncbi:hypothetical protein [Pseudovibrio sp. Alg231-02]|uniref:hypothetical protein n=1 Tax=Pseudovibrio sp. Alg231-02 TaxID=1922223 RepID=UPI0018FF6F78|nr:hypothetical protein [Pseudovibrio sp. Alg231-02]